MVENSDLIDSEEEETLGDIVVESGSVMNRRKSIEIVDGVVKKSSRSTHYFASCGHVVHHATDLGGRCGNNCGAIACKECTRTCNRCLKILCPAHTNMHYGLAYCPWCKWMVALGFSHSNSSVDDED